MLCGRHCQKREELEMREELECVKGYGRRNGRKSLVLYVKLRVSVVSRVFISLSGGESPGFDSYLQNGCKCEKDTFHPI